LKISLGALAPGSDVTRVMTPSNAHSQKVPPAVLRYGLAVGSVAIALGPALVLQHFKFRDVEFPLFLFAVALTAWHAGLGPATLSIALASVCFDYFFTEPFYSLYSFVSPC
jgi:K+-sensing histidine kinase KdpD